MIKITAEIETDWYSENERTSFAKYSIEKSCISEDSSVEDYAKLFQQLLSAIGFSEKAIAQYIQTEFLNEEN